MSDVATFHFCDYSGIRAGQSSPLNHSSKPGGDLKRIIQSILWCTSSNTTNLMSCYVFRDRARDCSQL